MGSFLIRRLLYLAPLWVGISLIAFILASLAPGDPARMSAQELAGRPPTPEEVAAERERLGLSAPFPVRYVHWLGNAVQGDFGFSYRSGEPVTAALLQRLPSTLQLAAAATLLAVALALPLGVLGAIRRNSPADHLTRAVAMAGASMPSYWLAYLLILVFAVRLHWLPVSGRGGWQHLVLPAVALGLGSAAVLMRLTRAELLETLNQDYVQTGRAKGLSESRVVTGHALRNALIPVVTMTGIQFGTLLGGAAIVETVFAWPGIGKFLVDSISARDYPVIQGFVIVAGTTFLLINLAVDVAYAWLDPRIRLAVS
ncbi:MAG: nickel ABC transporter permease [Thermomicrobiales bacterium]